MMQRAWRRGGVSGDGAAGCLRHSLRRMLGSAVGRIVLGLLMSPRKTSSAATRCWGPGAPPRTRLLVDFRQAKKPQQNPPLDGEVSSPITLCYHSARSPARGRMPRHRRRHWSRGIEKISPLQHPKSAIFLLQAAVSGYPAHSSRSSGAHGMASASRRLEHSLVRREHRRCSSKPRRRTEFYDW